MFLSEYIKYQVYITIYLDSIHASSTFFAVICSSANKKIPNWQYSLFKWFNQHVNMFNVACHDLKGLCFIVRGVYIVNTDLNTFQSVAIPVYLLYWSTFYDAGKVTFMWLFWMTFMTFNVTFHYLTWLKIQFHLFPRILYNLSWWLRKHEE